jgi:hypothetical protein
MPPLVNPPEQENVEPPAANASSENPVDDDSASATVEQTNVETPLVVERVARVPQLSAAVAVFTAGFGLLPDTRPTELRSRTRRRRRST